MMLLLVTKGTLIRLLLSFSHVVRIGIYTSSVCHCMSKYIIDVQECKSQGLG